MHATHDEQHGQGHDSHGSDVRKDTEKVDSPVLDGSEDHSEGDVDPRKGMTDPALIRDIESGEKTVNPYG